MSQNFPADMTAFGLSGAMSDVMSRIVTALLAQRSSLSGTARPTAGLEAGFLHYDTVSGSLWCNFGDRGWGPTGWRAVRRVSATGDIESSDGAILVDTSGAPVTMTLPPIIAPTSTDDNMDGRVFVVVNLGGNPLTIEADGDDVLDAVEITVTGGTAVFLGNENPGGDPTWHKLFQTTEPGDLSVSSLTITETDAGSVGAQIDTIHDSASPAVSDEVFRHQIKGRNASAGLVTLAQVRTLVKNVTAGAEESEFQIGIMKAGVLVPASAVCKVAGGAVRFYVAGIELPSDATLLSAMGTLDPTADLFAIWDASAGAWVKMTPDAYMDAALARAAAVAKVSRSSWASYNTSQNVELAIAWTQTDEESVAGMHDPSSNNNRLIAVLAGLYQYWGGFEFSTTSSVSGNWYGAVKDSGGGYVEISRGPTSVAMTGARIAKMGGSIRLAANGWIEFIAYQNLATTLGFSTATWAPYFGMRRIAA